jgi:tetratricopeptide (TPR) repeat protein
VLIAREKANTEAAYQRITEEQARTKAAYEAAVGNFQQARRILDFFSQVSAEELADKPGAQEVRRKLLQAALEYYQNFIRHPTDDPSTREELARSHLRVADLLNEMGATADALAALEQADRILETKPDPEAPAAFLRSPSQLAAERRPAPAAGAAVGPGGADTLGRASAARGPSGAPEAHGLLE